MKIKKNLKLILALLIFAFPTSASAVDTEFGGANNVAEYLSLVLKWVVPMASGLAVLIIIYAGYKYMTSQGNQEAISEAKDLIIGVIVGILLLFSIKIIIDVVGLK
jgi:type IV secretory pathway VirB2 component (pilin)